MDMGLSLMDARDYDDDDDVRASTIRRQMARLEIGGSGKAVIQNDQHTQAKLLEKNMQTRGSFKCSRRNWTW